MRGARPLRQAHRKNLGYGVRREQRQQPDGFRGLGRRGGLQRLDQALRGVFAKPTYNFAEKLAIIAKTAMTETMGDVMQSSLGHQRQDIDHAVGYLPATQRFFHKLRHALFGADARPQTLRRTGTLRLHVVQRSERLLHGRIATLAGRFLAEPDKCRAHKGLQLGLAFNG